MGNFRAGEEGSRGGQGGRTFTHFPHTFGVGKQETTIHTFGEALEEFLICSTRDGAILVVPLPLRTN